MSARTSKVKLQHVKNSVCSPGLLTSAIIDLQSCQRLEPARRARGQRCPDGHWETLTFIAGLRQTGIVAPMLIKEP
jgi:hypothetical protein